MQENGQQIQLTTVPSKLLLPGEGAVGTYGDLLKQGRRGDNLTPHHIPANAFMTAKVPEYSRNKGIAIMMEHISPGKGGRHRQTLSYGKSPNLNLNPRQTLAREIWDIRAIYHRDNLYIASIRNSLQQVIQQNKLAWPDTFKRQRS